MDGNGRWAKRQGLPRIAGHRQGVKTLKELVHCCKHWGIPVLTAYAFSTENWHRPQAEVGFLMGLFETVLAQELAPLCRQGVRLSFIGDLSILPQSLQRMIEQSVQMTQHNQAVHLMIALNYGGRSEITQACRKIAALVQQGQLSVTQINEMTIADHLMTMGTPDPDLLIRTSHELRLSNFLPWQSAYTELYFTDTVWPDFGPAEFYQALLDYQRRDRRFGQVSQTA
ncbi:di-trans,poly-cis-decaprenylcistransferase [filamentous cyanobacterium LEGE 11480]|uniref:Isoprenyl transferase n=2 Tax=Romeriopsis TaxID=2992131 RepID=A0A928VLZ7_9CYAN|nr:di-trans,poly-cis-decaprenylcistransferase [Romeriopsis navalis LEGE 11480]